MTAGKDSKTSEMFFMIIMFKLAKILLYATSTLLKFDIALVAAYRKKIDYNHKVAYTSIYSIFTFSCWRVGKMTTNDIT